MAKDKGIELCKIREVTKQMDYDQWKNCYLRCRITYCPPEKIMEARLNPKEFRCTLWQETQ